jgi:hypothetical protein
MINRVSSLLIGKDISRDAQVVAGAQLDTIVKSTGLAAGEIVVLDKDKKVMASGATIADTDTIYIVQSYAETFDYTNVAGTAVTGNRKIKMSGPIVGAKVKNYFGKAYTAKAEQTAQVDLTGWTPVVGTEYIIRIVYKDLNEHPGRFTQTYRHVATTTTLDTEGAALAAKVNAHAGSRVTATYTTNTDVLLLTAKEIPESCTALTDIDYFRMVEFDVYFNYVTSAGVWATIPSTSTTVTYSAANPGSGNWEQIRDLEKQVQPHRGITNVTHFPVIEPAMETVVDSNYDMIVIEHEVPYQSPDNQYVKDAPQTTVLAVVDGASQMTDILAQLNPWMASCPGAFANISF